MKLLMSKFVKHQKKDRDDAKMGGTSGSPGNDTYKKIYRDGSDEDISMLKPVFKPTVRRM